MEITLFHHATLLHSVEGPD